MTTAWKSGALVAAGVAIGLTIAGIRSTEAQFGGGFGPAGGGLGGGFGQSQLGGSEPAERVYFQRPVSGAAAAVWLKLDQKLAMPFENDTPLGELLQYVRDKTGDEQDKGGIPFYVDPIGMQEAEQTLQSPVSINLKGLPLRTTLELALAQLDLRYEVLDEGFLIITSKEHDKRLPYSDELILDELKALREEVARLKK